MSNPIPKKCYDCEISARTRRQMLNVIDSATLAELQAYLREVCNECHRD